MLVGTGTSLAHTYSVPHAAYGGGHHVTHRYYIEYDQPNRIGTSAQSANMVYDLKHGPVMTFSHVTDGSLTKPDASDFQ